MPSSSDVFIISACVTDAPVDAMRRALENSDVKAARIQDFIFGTDDAEMPDPQALARLTGLACPVVTVSSSLRALGFAAQSILCEEAYLVLVGGAQGGQCAALLLASPAAVGVHNLMPLARLDAFSLSGADVALKKAELAAEDVQINLQGTCGVLLAVELVQTLGEQQAAWGMLTVDNAVILIERV